MYTTIKLLIPIDYAIIRGKPSHVESEVQRLINADEGWVLNGALQFTNVENVEIAVQSMVQYKDYGTI